MTPTTPTPSTTTPRPASRGGDASARELSEGQLDPGPGRRARTVRFTGLALGLVLAILSGLALP